MFAIKRAFSRNLKNAWIPSLGLVLAVLFWNATAPAARADGSAWTPPWGTNNWGNNQGSGSNGNNGDDHHSDWHGWDWHGNDNHGSDNHGDCNKCDVCDNPHNYHTISVPCDQVNQFIACHPGDYRGNCEATPIGNR